MRSSAFVVGLILSCSASLAAAAGADNIFGVEMPSSLEDFDAVAYNDAEVDVAFRKLYASFFFQEKREYGSPELGYSLGYATPSLEFITIYVYDNGLADIPNGSEAELIARELAVAAEAIESAGQYGQISEHTAESLSPHFAQVFHMGTAPSGEAIKSYTLLRGHRDHFIKLRITGATQALEPRSAAFLEYLAADLGL
jgi:hypothetical protein